METSRNFSARLVFSTPLGDGAEVTPVKHRNFLFKSTSLALFFLYPGSFSPCALA